jgi:vacuolar protein sorting-associated protein VTA1
VRIAKAIKEGKDPNESNPKREEVVQEPQAPALDPNDPEVQALNALDGPPPIPGPRPAMVEDAPDAADGMLDVKKDEAGVSLPPSPLPASANLHSAPADYQLPDAPTGGHQSGAQPGYFDNSLPSPEPPPSQPGQPPTTTSPWAPTPPAATRPPPQQPSVPRVHSPPIVPSTFASAPAQTPAIAPPTPVNQPPPPTYASPPPATAPVAPATSNPAAFYAPTAPAIAPTVPNPARTPYPPPAAPAPTQVGGPVSEMAMAQAQKHAKWAISALNFEDVNTAVKELRAALQSLGAG